MSRALTQVFARSLLRALPAPLRPGHPGERESAHQHGKCQGRMGSGDWSWDGRTFQDKVGLYVLLADA